MFKRALSTALLLATITASAPPSALAARTNGATYDLVCIWNDTDSTVNFSYRGNADSEWQDVALEPGDWKGIYWNDTRSFHAVTVEYDSDTSDDVDWDKDDIYPIDARTTNCEKSGSDYSFSPLFGDYISLSED